MTFDPKKPGCKNCENWNDKNDKGDKCEAPGGIEMDVGLTCCIKHKWRKKYGNTI